jgi:phosphoserine phosphatase
MIEPIALKLKIPTYRIYANNLLFFDDEHGSFKGFDATEPTSRDGGKAAVIKRLIDAHGYKPIVVVGDGITDLQAKPPANLFIGYGGVVEREVVKKGADWYVKNFDDLIKVLK